MGVGLYIIFRPSLTPTFSSNLYQSKNCCCKSSIFELLICIQSRHVSVNFYIFVVTLIYVLVLSKIHTRNEERNSVKDKKKNKQQRNNDMDKHNREKKDKNKQRLVWLPIIDRMSNRRTNQH